jgi:hypothetical protein
MGRSHKYYELDRRKRIALGTLARHDLYMANVDERGVITLTPAEVTPLASVPIPTRRRQPRKKAAPAAAETPQEQE